MTDPAETPPPLSPVDLLLHFLARLEGDLREMRAEMREIRAEFRTEIHRLDEKIDKLAGSSIGQTAFWGAIGLVLATVIGFGAVLVAR
jgi:hypothetical protein